MRGLLALVAILILGAGGWFGYQYWDRDGDNPETAAEPTPPSASDRASTAATDADAPAPPGQQAARTDAAPSSEADRAAPGAPATGIAPSFDVVRINRSCTGVVAGRAAPRAEVTVFAGDVAVGRVTADGRGEWVLIVEQPLPAGSQELSLSAVHAGGAALGARENVVLVVPDCSLPDEDRGPAIAILTPNAGPSEQQRGSTLLQGPAGGAEADGLQVGAIDYDDGGNVALSGRAAPNTRVQAYVNNRFVGVGQADAEGNWQVVPEEPVAPGVHSLRIDQVDDEGKVQSRVQLPFSRAEAQDLALTEGRVVVQPGNSLWRIARRTYGEGLRYAVIYEANRDRIADPDLIYPGQVFVLPDRE